MNLLRSIQEICLDLNITSRTLRHWESEGLFTSIRDKYSGWRMYNREAIISIEITKCLRDLDISIKDIKSILQDNSYYMIRKIVNNELKLYKSKEIELETRRNQLTNILSKLKDMGVNDVKEGSLKDQYKDLIMILNQKEVYKKEKENMSFDKKINNIEPKFIQLPPMRVVYHIAIGPSPEDEAMFPVLTWLESSNLLGTARLFGGNVKPFPNKNNLEYGYGMCASIPEEIKIPSHLKEMRLPGGLYAMISSSEDISKSWNELIEYLKNHDEYKSDRSRLCLEEHIRKHNTQVQGNQFYLNLLEPVKKK